jgi:uncharacterized protein with HEPN domain
VSRTEQEALTDALHHLHARVRNRIAHGYHTVNAVLRITVNDELPHTTSGTSSSATCTRRIEPPITT